MQWKRGKSGGLCCANSISDFRKFEVSYNVRAGVVLDKGLVDRCLANVCSGKRQVGKEDEAGHGLTDSVSLGSGDCTRWIGCRLHGQPLIVMHKVGKLGVGIGEIDLKIADISEIF